MIAIMSVIIAAIFIGFLVSLRKEKLTTKLIVVIAMFSAVAFILSLIKFIRYPQGGGISLFSMMPIMLLSVLYGKRIGVTGGLVFGILGVIQGTFVIHPVQFILDCLIAPMGLGIAGIFGSSKKIKIVFGCLIATGLSVFAHFVSGVVFFGQFAPEGMNVALYSFMYNFSSSGVEGILSTLIVAFLPIDNLKKLLKII